MSLLEDLITAVTAVAGVTAYDGHIYKNKELSGDCLITVQKSNIITEGIASDLIERPFTIKLYAKDQTTLTSLAALIRTAVNISVTNGFWKIYDEQPDYTESRKNLIFFGKQHKVE